MFLELVPKGQYRISEKQGSLCLVARPPQEAVVWELLLRSLLIGRRKQ